MQTVFVRKYLKKCDKQPWYSTIQREQQACFKENFQDTMPISTGNYKSSVGDIYCYVQEVK